MSRISRKPTEEQVNEYINRNSTRQSRAEIAEMIVVEKLKIRRKISERKDIDTFKEEINIDDHIIPLNELALRYETNLVTGLSNARAAEFLRIYGPNCLRPPKSKSMWVTLAEYMFGGFSVILWFATVLSFTGFTMSYLDDPVDVDMDNVYLGAVIFCIICITGFFGFYQEYSNTTIMEGFGKMIPKTATVIRSGVPIIVSAESIVIGDIVLLEGGDCVSADIRILEASAFKVDNSSITGESDPQSRTPEFTDVNPLETHNLAFYGTNVVEGSAKGVVIACGEETLMGHIAALTSGLQAEITPIKKELKSFTRIITVIAVIMGCIFFSLAMIAGETFFESFATFIAIVVANVPEGLLVTMTACLTLTAKKMVKKNCLCKNLHAVETLGSTTVICSDKTGTLTQNKMTVAHMYYDHMIFDLMGEKHSSRSESFRDLCRVGILCSRAEFLRGQDAYSINDRLVKGDASETAILKCMEYIVGETKKYRYRFPKIFEIPFNSTNKFQVSIHTQPEDEELLLVMKGAPEKIIERCATIANNGEDIELDEANGDILKAALLELGYLGERVLAFADLELPPSFDEDFHFDSENFNFPLEGLRLLGFMSMIDPPRDGVLDAVEKCKEAGIRVIMVTGDHPVTALAIAKKVGIISPLAITAYDIAMKKNVSVTKLTDEEKMKCNAAVITGTNLRNLKGDQLDDIVNEFEEIVFARTSPQQKLQIVESFQRNFEVVAVTGDGVNDSPALKKADIGVAMGISGSDVSKEAADMILLDDNFASIVVGIEEGRLIFDNLKKSIAYMLTSNVPEMLPIVLNVLLGIPLPINVMAILIIDVGTDLWPSISLAYEKSEADIMKRKPRDKHKDKLVTMKLIIFTNLNIGVIQTLAGMNCYFYVMAEHGFLPGRLLGIRKEWMSQANDIKDSFGQEWSSFERKQLERRCAAAFFLAVVLTQIADVVICKTRRLSICEQGMGNQVMNFGIAFEIFISLLVVYCPYINEFATLLPVNPNAVTPAIPYAFLIIIFDETRKYLIRSNPNGWFDRETYY